MRRFSSYINGTIPITFSIGKAIPTVEQAGWVISSRSGLCDLISSANCKQSIILDRAWYSGTVFSCSSLKEMGLAETACEYQVKEGEDLGLLAEKILGDR